MSDSGFPPLPKNEEKRTVKADVNKILADRALDIAEKMKLKQVQVIEWGLQAFIEKYEAEAAKTKKGGRK